MTEQELINSCNFHMDMFNNLAKAIVYHCDNQKPPEELRINNVIGCYIDLLNKDLENTRFLEKTLDLYEND